MEPSCSVAASGDDDAVPKNQLRLVEILDIKLVEMRDVSIRHSPISSGSSSSSDKSMFCLVKLDREEIFGSSTVSRTRNPFFGDEFHFPVSKNFSYLSFYVYDRIANRVPRPIGRVTFRKQDIAKYSGMDRWWRLKPLSRQSDVTGKVWLEISHSNPTASEASSAANDGSKPNQLAVRILDYCDLNLIRSNDLYAVVSLQYSDGAIETKKLRIRRKPSTSTQSSGSGGVPSASALFSNEAAVFALKPSSIGCSHSAPVLRVTVWHDILGSFSSYFHGEVRVFLDSSFDNLAKSLSHPYCAWYYLKPRSNSSSSTSTSGAVGNDISQNETGDNYLPTVATTASSPSLPSMNGRENDLGSLRLKITYTVNHILPTSCYNELWSHLLDALSVQPFRCSAVGLLSALPCTNLEQVARPLVKIFLNSEQLPSLIRVLCTEEIAKCQDVNTLFRSSSLASKCIYESMKLVGQQYLICTLKSCVDTLFAECRSCEIDPVRLPPGECLAVNTTQLVVYTEMMLSRILDSNHRCPQLLKDIFRILRETTQRYYNDMKVQWLVLGSFLIMRFFAAALLNPKLFGLKRENPNPTVGRTLALISKIVQRLSNYVVVGRALTEKEPFLSPVFSRFTDESHRLSFIKFFDRISCVGGENSITGESLTILKEGILKQRIPKQCKTPLSWHLTTCLNFRHVIRRSSVRPRFCCLTETEFCWYKEKGQSLLGRMALSDVSIVQTADELFNNRSVIEISDDRESVFLEATNNIELSEWVVALQRACKRQRLAKQQLTESAAQMYDIDLEQQLETIHMIFLANADILRAWKDDLDYSAPLQDSIVSYEAHLAPVDVSCRNVFYDSICKALRSAYTLEQKHLKYFKQIKYGSKDMPIGDDNYLLLGTRMRDYAAVWGVNRSDDVMPMEQSSISSPWTPQPSQHAPVAEIQSNLRYQSDD